VNPARVLVTGATGQDGSYLVDVVSRRVEHDPELLAAAG
jgi:GDP-D-mannose dehydratase